MFPIPVADGRVLTPVSRCDPPLMRVAGRECALPTSKVHKTLVSVAGRLNDEWPTQLWGTAAPARSPPDHDAAALLPFRNGVAQYVGLHHRVETPIAPETLPTDAVNLYVMPRPCGAKRRARTGPQEGTILTPRAAAIFKRLIAQTV